MRLGVAHVELHREAADGLGGLRRGLAVDVGGEHGVPAPGELLRDLAPEAAAGAGDHGDARHQPTGAATRGRPAGSARRSPRVRLRSRASMRMYGWKSTWIVWRVEAT